LNTYKSEPTDKILLKNNDVINITESEIKSIQMLFEQLKIRQTDKKWRKQSLMIPKHSDNTLNFYKETQELV
jgi:hypothetical protein